KMIKKKKLESKKAMKILGVKKIEFNTLPDMKLDKVAHVDVNKIIEEKIKEFQPEIVYTHYWRDINKDHKLVFESTLVAVRPIPSQTVKKLYVYEVPSSTEWNIHGFNANVFEDINSFLDKKLDAIRCYESEIREYPHPRSVKAIEIYNKKNGISVGKKAVERFKLIRELK
ncbi:MAG: PIG-L family deacetylase, partial [Thermoplasmatales archaeon]